MLPAPPASCAGWWFAQLWLSLAGSGRTLIAGWQVVDARPGKLELRPNTGPSAAQDNVLGEYPVPGSEGERTIVVARHWPGEDSMQHYVRMTWHLGEIAAYPGSWGRLRSTPVLGDMAPSPFPHCLPISALGRQNDPLDQVVLEVDGRRVRWSPPFGQPRLPIGEISAVVSSSEQGVAEVAIAGLPLPWKVDLDREALPVWRRLRAERFLAELGDVRPCPRHGDSCPWLHAEAGRPVR